jgi:predicted DNA-binding protein
MKRDTKGATLHFRVPPELRRCLERMAKRDGRTLSQMAVRVLERGCRQMELNTVAGAADWAARGFRG